MSDQPAPVIRTPDQLLRVFVSSTLRELAAERRVARQAIERLRLAPVMFELGARPHPPRSLYRSYLAQSDVFVGIYGDSYGWVAPDEEVSGLEDEYNLAPASMPKLIYIKASQSRDDRLNELIDRIRSDDTAAYLPFETPEQLEEQIVGDLATLLAERFDAARGDEAAPAEPAAAGALGLLAHHRPRTASSPRSWRSSGSGEQRLVTLLGPGGIGKSRLAIETAAAAGDLFPDGPVFIALENVLEPSLLLPTIAYGLGIRDSGERAIEERLARRARRAADAHRPRQLRAGRRGRARDRPAVHARTGCRVPRHEPDRAAHPRRARVRGAASGDDGRRRTGIRQRARRYRPRSSCSSNAPGPSSPTSRSRRRTPRPSSRSARRWTGCRSRSSWPRRACGS